MNKIRLRNLGVVGAFVVLFLIYFEYQSSRLFNVNTEPKFVIAQAEDSNEEAEAESENPQKRLEYEMDMLKDPSTGKIPFDIRHKELSYVRALNETDRNNIRSSAAGISQTNASPFVNFGPFNIGGRTRALAIDVSDENILLAGGISGGVWRSTDQGTSWTRTTNFDQIPSVTTIVQDIRTGKTANWYYATGENIGNSVSETGAFYLGDGIYKSTNGGVSWSLISGTAINSVSSLGKFSLVNKLAIDYSNQTETELYVAGLSKIYRTVNDFQSVTTVLGLSNTGVGNSADIAIASDGTIIASIPNKSSNGSNAEEGIFISSDGISWTSITLPAAWPSTFRRVELAFDPHDSNFFYALGESFFYKYDRSTSTWTALTGNINVNSESVEGFDGQGGYNLEVAVHPGNQNTVFIGGTNLLRSPNGFTLETDRKHIGGYTGTGTAGPYENHHPDIHTLSFLPSDPKKMFSGSDGGVHITNDNTASTVVWTSLNNGYVTSQFYTVDLYRDDRGDNQIIGGMQDNGTWAIFQNNPIGVWIQAYGGDGAYSAISYNSLYASAQEGQMGRFELVDNTYQASEDIAPTDDSDEFLFINPFIVDRVNQDRMYVAAKGKIYYTYDVRKNPGKGEWEEISGTGITSQPVAALATSVQPEGVLYFGTTTGRLQKIANTKEITSVENISASNLPQGASVTSIAVDPRNANRVFVTFGNYGVISVWMSEDGGGTWSSISGNLEENANGSGNGPSVRSIEILPNGTSGEKMFVGTSTGLYMTSSLNGNSTVWTQQATSIIGNSIVNMVKVRPIDGKVIAATHGSGVFVGYYDTGFNPEINYSMTGESSAVLRANQSFNQGQGFGFKWFKDGSVISGQTGAELIVNANGTYKCEVTDQLGPVAFTNEVAFNFDVVAGIDDDPIQVSAQVSPNPSNAVFNVNLDAAYATGFDYTIVNSNGNQVITGKKEFYNTEERFRVNLSTMPDGLYILNVNNDKRRDIIKLLKQSN
ncbi:T9SS type A sorting domain-containing protein [Roseivirga sp.]|uniref:T9SS type A sorting domain-containing protein n=1 Tax=Roseivirga sp. TaxID=1964215 RepID=UPI002B26AD42|nr:T9SS type A sorting domain-containing protein [Roseivirga sp.]